MLGCKAGGWRLNDVHVWGQSWKASEMFDEGLQGGEDWEEAKLAALASWDCWDWDG